MSDALLERAREALESLVGQDVCYAGNEIHIPAGSHLDAIQRVRTARNVLFALTSPSSEGEAVAALQNPPEATS